MDTSMDILSMKCPWTVHGQDTSWTLFHPEPRKISKIYKLYKQLFKNFIKYYIFYMNLPIRKIYQKFEEQMTYKKLK